MANAEAYLLNSGGDTFVIVDESPGDQEPNIHTLCVLTHRPRWARHRKLQTRGLLGGIGGSESGVGIAAIPRVSSGFNSPSEHPLKGIPIMDATVKMVLVIALVAAVVLLLFFGGGMTTGTMSGGMMGR